MEAVQAVGSFELLVLGHLLKHVTGYELRHVLEYGLKQVLSHTADKHMHNHVLKQMAHALPMT